MTVWVDTGTDSLGRPDAQTDYFYVYQGSSVGFTAAQLLDNDSDPENQTITVAVVSEPSNNGILVGNPTDGYTYTPSTDAALAGINSNLLYLVTDTDGHVEQGTITIRILAAGDPNQPPVARADVARTNAGTQVGVLVMDNDFDPDDDTFSIVEVANPANGTAVIMAPSSTTPRPTASPASKPSPTPSATATASPQQGR